MKGSIKMKANREAKSERSPQLLTIGGVEILAIPPSIKRMAKGRKIDVWTHPFKCGLNSARDEVISETPEKVAFNQRLTKMQLGVINCAVGSENMSDIKSFLIQKCNVPDPTNLAWTEILSHLKVYLHSQKAGQPAEPDKVKGGTEAYRGPRRQVPTSDADRQRAFLGGYTVGEYKYAPDLPTGEAAEKQNTGPAKSWRMWDCVKRIPRWIYILVIFLAALLTCIYLSWWLWTKFSA